MNIERGIECGIERGIERGIEQGERRSTLRLMDAKFGPLSAKVKQQVDTLSPETLAQLQLDLLKAQTLEELHLDDSKPWRQRVEPGITRISERIRQALQRQSFPVRQDHVGDANPF